LTIAVGEEAQVFCSNCGARLLEGARFCNQCGATVAIGAAAERTGEPAPVRYAGFWRRLWAFLVDGAWVFLLAAPLQLALGLDIGNEATPDWSRPIELAGLGISQGIAWLYAALFMCSPAQGTLGQLLFNVKVTDVEGRRISFLRATGRHFAEFISLALLGVGYLMIAFNERKRALHDLIAGTLVVRREDRGNVAPR
jgi:uncharacterized RDD family membrane protein YckC